MHDVHPTLCISDITHGIVIFQLGQHVTLLFLNSENTDLVIVEDDMADMHDVHPTLCISDITHDIFIP